jgi:hypothetical protein
LVGFFVGQILTERARRERGDAVRIARADREEQLETKRREYRPTRSWFTYQEERTGRPDGSAGPQAEIDAAAKRRAAYVTLAQRVGDFEVIEMQSDERFEWAALLSPGQIANFGISDNYEPISKEQYMMNRRRCGRMRIIVIELC